jgi:hypothetical protein
MLLSWVVDLTSATQSHGPLRRGTHRWTSRGRCIRATGRINHRDAVSVMGSTPVRSTNHRHNEMWDQV